MYKINYTLDNEITGGSKKADEFAQVEGLEDVSLDNEGDDEEDAEAADVDSAAAADAEETAAGDKHAAKAAAADAGAISLAEFRPDAPTDDPPDRPPHAVPRRHDIQRWCLRSLPKGNVQQRSGQQRMLGLRDRPLRRLERND